MTITLKNFIENEGNFVRFNYNGYIVSIIRDSEDGHLGGFIQLSENHPLNKLDIEEIEALYNGMLPAHGGLNYSGRIIGNSFKTIGFECNHLGDVVPIDNMDLEFDHSGYFRNDLNHTYKDMEYVRENIIEIIDYIENTTIDSVHYLNLAGYDRMYA